MQSHLAGKDHAVINSGKGKGHVPAQSAKGRMPTGFEGTVQVVNLQQQSNRCEMQTKAKSTCRQRCNLCRGALFPFMLANMHVPVNLPAFYHSQQVLLHAHLRQRDLHGKALRHNLTKPSPKLWFFI